MCWASQWAILMTSGPTGTSQLGSGGPQGALGGVGASGGGGSTLPSLQPQLLQLSPEGTPQRGKLRLSFGRTHQSTRARTPATRGALKYRILVAPVETMGVA